MLLRLIKSLAWCLAGQLIALILVNSMQAYAHVWNSTNNSEIKLDYLQLLTNNLNQQTMQLKNQQNFITHEQQQSPSVLNQTKIFKNAPFHSHHTNLSKLANSNQDDLEEERIRTKRLKGEKVKEQQQQQPQSFESNSHDKTTRTETPTGTQKVTTKVKFKLNQESRDDEEDDPVAGDVTIQAKRVRSQEQMPTKTTSNSGHVVAKREVSRLGQQVNATDSSLNRSGGDNLMVEFTSIPYKSNALNSELNRDQVELSELTTRSGRRVRSTEPLANQTTVHSLVGERISIPCSNLTIGNSLSPQQHNEKVYPSNKRHSNNQQKPHRSNGQNLDSRPGSSYISGVSLIVWHKDDQLNSPIFVADARGVSSLREAKQQILAEHLAGRTRLQFIEDTQAATPSQLAPHLALPSLLIEESTQQDAGTYTCTVEFHKAPTQTYQVRAQIIEPPKNMVLRDETTQQKLYPPLAGPFDEDSRLALSCEVELPSQPNVMETNDNNNHVSWWQLDSVTQLNGDFSLASLKDSDLVPVESASYLTTLSADQSTNAPPPPATLMIDEDATTRLAHENQLIGSYATRTALDSVLSQQRTLPSSTAANQIHRQQPHQRRYLKHWRRFTNQTVQQHSGSNLKQSTMFINQLNRSNLGDEFMCLASNNNFSSPVNATVRLNLNLKPVEVRIINKPTVGSFRLGQKSIVECHVFGSKPSAKISWFRGSDELELLTSSRGGTKKDSSNQEQDPAEEEFLVNEFSRDMNNLTKISYLTMMPKLSDNQLSLTCSASNPKLTNSPVLSDTILMNVQYPPRLNLQLGSSFSRINPTNGDEAIKIGSDIFMDCQIDANPRIDDLTWLFNDSPVQANISAGIIMSNQSLVLQKIKTYQRGSYQCLAQNLLGKTASNKLVLKPKFKPQCDLSRTKLKYELPINQAARIECHVLAEPGDDLDFTWRFNQTYGLQAADLTLDSYHVEQLRKFETNFTKSSLIFVPKTRRHYGQLLCSASNSMGEQEQPCSIQVIPLELPDPVLNCFIDNQTDSSFSVHCQPPATTTTSSTTHLPGQSGYNRQSTRYLLELYANEADDAGSSSPSATHLRMRQQAPNSPGEEDYHSFAPDSGHQSNNNLDTEQQQQHLEQRNQFKLKSLISETPNFNVLDLKPNTSYNLLVFVENSKGKSTPAHHVASTKSVDSRGWNILELASQDQQQEEEYSSAKNPNASGRVELMSKNKSNVQPNVASKLISYLKIDSYFTSDFWSHDKTNPNSNQIRLLVGLGSIVVLFAISIVCGAVFINKVCVGRRASRGASRQTKTGSKRKKSDTQRQQMNDVKPTTTRHEPNDDDDGASEKHYLSATTVSQRQTIGSGSDTSRETNTESTLISSPQTTRTTEESSSLATNKIRFVAFRDSHHSLGRPSRKCAKNIGPVPRPDCTSSLSNQIDNPHCVQQPRGDIYTININKNGNSLAAQQQQHLASQNYCDQQHSYTPQAASIQSESDCCLSANDQSSDHLLERTNQQQKLVGFLTDQSNVDNDYDQQPVYFISRNDLQLQQQAFQANGQNEIWSIDSSPSCAIGQNNRENSSVATLEFSGASLDQQHSRLNSCQPIVQQNGRCQLVDSTTTVTPTPMSYMPSSISIPISLSDRLQVLTRSNSSQNNLMALQQQQQQQSQEFAMHPNNHSFLTLVPSSSSSCLYQGSNVCAQDSYFPASNGPHEQEQQAEIAPPMDFASDYRRFKEKFGITNVAQQQAQFGDYCTQTLDQVGRSSLVNRQNLGPGQQQSIARKRRNSFNDNEAQSQQQQTKSLQNRVKFDTNLGEQN